MELNNPEHVVFARVRWFAGKLGEQFQGLVHFLRGVLSLPGKAAAVAKNAAHSLAGMFADFQRLGMRFQAIFLRKTPLT